MNTYTYTTQCGEFTTELETGDRMVSADEFTAVQCEGSDGWSAWVKPGSGSWVKVGTYADSSEAWAAGDMELERSFEIQAAGRPHHRRGDLTMSLITFLCGDRKIRTFRVPSPIARQLSAGLTSASLHHVITEATGKEYRP